MKSGLKSGGSWIQVNKISIFQANFREISIFFQAISQQILIFPGKFLKNFDFFRQILKNFDFPGKNCSFTATSGQIILFLFEGHHFRTYMHFLYMIRYNNISRPVHDLPRPPATSNDLPAQNLGREVVRDPNPQD